MSEKFLISKAIDFKPDTIAKSSSLVFKGLIPFLLLGFIIWSVWTAFNKPSQQIIAKKGSEVKVTQINKTSRFFIPFIEAGVEQNKWQDMGTYIRAGIRIEF